MDNHLISIIVPVYNLESYIEKTVCSITQQTYKNIEIILVNDGSTDNSLQIIEQLAKKDRRIKTLHKKNGGVTHARLAGLEIATGEWIGFVDGDDLIKPDMYEHLLFNALEYHADISHCGYQMVFPSRIDYYYNTGKIIEQNKERGLKDLLEGEFVEPGLCNKLFHKSLLNVFLQDNKMDCSIKINEDLLMNYYLFTYAKKSIYEDICPYQYMIRAGSAATSKINEHKLRDPLHVLKIIENELGDNKLLHPIIMNRIYSELIRISTISIKGQEVLLHPYKKLARKELRYLLKDAIGGPYNKKKKIMVIWAAICPVSYQYVHKLYARLSGLDKKYEVS